MKRVFSVAIASLLFAHPVAGAICCCPGGWNPHVDIDVRQGSFRRGVGADLFVPLHQDGRSLLFAQGGGGRWRGLSTGTLGVGYRRLVCPSLAAGANLFGDVSRSYFGGTYGQVGGGGELFGSNWLLRGNFYVPISQRRHFTGSDGEGYYQFPYKGLDGEGGLRVCLGPGELWGLAGGYWYTRSDTRDLGGPRLRLQYRRYLPRGLGELVIGGEYDYDRVHRHTGLFVIRLELAAPCRRVGCPTTLCRQMGRSVWRERAVWVEIFHNYTPSEDWSQLIFANNLNNGIGTQTDPAMIDRAVQMLAETGEGQVLFLLNDTGVMSPSSSIVLQSNQQVQGFGDEKTKTITLANGRTLTVTDLTGAGRGVLNGESLSPAIELAQGATLSGFAVDQSLTAVRQSVGAGSCRVEDVIFTAPQQTAILNDGGESLTIDRIAVGGTPQMGVRLVMVTGDQQIRDSSIFGQIGISLEDIQGPVISVSEETIVVGVGINAMNALDTEALQIRHSAFEGVGETTLVNLQSTAVPQSLAVQVGDVHFQGGAMGLCVSALGSTALLVENSSFEATGEGISLVLANPLTLQNTGVIRNCTFSEGAVGIHDPTMRQGSWLYASNTFSRVGSETQSPIMVSGGPAEGALFNLTLLDNGVDSSPNPTGYAATTEGIGHCCLTMRGNRQSPLSETDAVLLGNHSNPIQLWDLARLTTDNPGMTFVIEDVVQANGPGALPILRPEERRSRRTPRPAKDRPTPGSWKEPTQRATPPLRERR